jgi:RND family efflux transporter MFP subunit
MYTFRKEIVVLLVMAVLAAGCQGLFGRPIEEEAPTPTPIATPIVPENPTYVVQRGRITKQLEFTGRISPVEETSLYFKTDGYVKRVLVERDDLVQAGDLLAELEIDDLLKQMAQAEVSLNTAQLRLDEAQKSLERQITQAEWRLQIAKVGQEEAAKSNERQIVEAQRALEEARLRLAQLQQEPDPVEVELLRLSWDRAKNNLWNAQLERDAVKGRSGTPGYVRTQMDIAVSNAEIAVREAELCYQQALQPTVSQDDVRLQQIEVERAKATLDQLQGGVDPLLAIEVQRAQQELDWLKEGVAPVLVNEVNQARLTLERLQAQVSDAQIVAPMDGRVLSRSLYPGRPVEAFKTVIVVADPSAIEVSADLSSSQLTDMVEGQKAVVTLRLYPGETWQGTVRRLPYPYGSGGGTGNLEGADESVRVSLEGELSSLELGDLARVTVVLEEKDDVLWLPPAALRTFQGRKFAILQDVNRQRRVDVQVGVQSDDRVEILEGLEEGQVVIGQ